MSILDTVTDLPCHPKNRGGSRKASQIRYLVYHYTGNDGDAAANNARYYRDNVVGASAHYFVDDGSITRSVPDLAVAWAVGGRKWADCAGTGGGKLYGVVTNTNSISIELCDTRRDGTLLATEATLERAAALGRELMKKYEIPIERVVRHFDVTGKHCPAYFMDEGAWETFKKRILEEEDTVVNKDEPARWASQAWEKAKEKKILDGTRPTEAVSRQELAVVMDRLGLLDKPAVRE